MTWVEQYRSPDHMTVMENLDGVVWYDAPIPSRRHRCTPQTKGWIGFDQVFRCACGAISRDCEHWSERNSRKEAV